MRKNSTELTTLQRKAIKALLNTNTRAEAAEMAGCSERSIYKWLRDPIFRAELAERENILRLDVGRRLAIDTIRIIDLLSDFIDQREALNDDRLWLRALELWLDYHIKTGTDIDIERRLTVLEAARANDSQ